MAKGKIALFEWKIKNFSCWCEAVHGQSIQSPDFIFTCFKKAELYPRGCSFRDDGLRVCFCDVRSDFTGELSFIGFDGSSMCTQQVVITQKGGRVLGPSVGPKFEEVVAQIRKANQKDQITLRFCIQYVREEEHHMCTTIDVWKESFKIYPKLIERSKSNNANTLYFRYTSKEGKGMYLKMRQLDKRIQLTMEPHDEDETAILVESSVNMLSSDNDLVRNEVVKHVFTDGEAWMFSESLTVKELEEKGIIILLGLKVIKGDIFHRYNYVINDKSVITVQNNNSTICFYEPRSSKSSASLNDSEYSSRELKKDLMCLFQDQDFSDFQLKCDNVTFPVHRAILSARSPVFKTMLSTDMKEAASGTVDIVDLDASTLGLFLTYLYTGAVEELQGKRALNLYYAADKYQVPSLKGECALFLSSNISIENVCDVLTLAIRHKDDNLNVVSHNFILNNYNEVLGSKEWANYVEIEPLLVAKTLTQFAQKKCVGKMHVP